jgi:hypothetical protein
MSPIFGLLLQSMRVRRKIYIAKRYFLLDQLSTCQQGKRRHCDEHLPVMDTVQAVSPISHHDLGTAQQISIVSLTDVRRTKIPENIVKGQPRNRQG